MLIKSFLLIAVIIFMFFFMPLFKDNMHNRKIFDKLGYTPQGDIYKSVLGEFRWFMGNYLSFKSIIYYGSKAESLKKGDLKGVEFYNLYRTIETSVKLNPYHEDTYYFSQAIFTWGIGRVKEVNALLEYILKYRKWDFQLPFFLGFNYSYFLKDYKMAGKYFKMAAEMTGSSLFTNLAARYFYEGGETELGIIFLEAMYKNANNENVKKHYKLRLDALKSIKLLEDTVKKFHEKMNRYPENIDELVEYNLLERIPEDPYGGKYFIDENKKIRTTSNFYFKKEEKP